MGETGQPWHGMAWHAMAWQGMPWYAMPCNGMPCHARAWDLVTFKALGYPGSLFPKTAATSN